MSRTATWLPLWLTRCGRSNLRLGGALAARVAEPRYLKWQPPEDENGLPMWLSVHHHKDHPAMMVIQVRNSVGEELNGVQWYDRVSGRRCDRWYDRERKRAGLRVTDEPFTVEWRKL